MFFQKSHQSRCFVLIDSLRYTGHKMKGYKLDCCLSSKDTHVLSCSEDGHVYCWDLVEVSIQLKERITSERGAIEGTRRYKRPLLRNSTLSGRTGACDHLFDFMIEQHVTVKMRLEVQVVKRSHQSTSASPFNPRLSVHRI